MSESQVAAELVAVVAGSDDFCRRSAATLTRNFPDIQCHTGNMGDSWGLVLTHRPNLLICEVGPRHSDRQHSRLRSLLESSRERFGEEIFIAVALTAPENFAFGGDLLFANEFDLAPSLFIDTFLLPPPANIPSIPSLAEQLTNVGELLKADLQRRSLGGPVLPALGSPGWVQSLADPKSRSLWMEWLPRYASYTNENPIIIGETGTGKTSLAYALHLLSGRKGDFVTITPRDFSSSELVQGELFGAVAGAYTGAVDKWGLVQRAEGGTLFIDELQSIDKDLQGKLITFIENKVYRRVGSTESIEADVRFVFASNRTLFDMMKNGILRDDFAYRLERVQLELLPLKMRRLDIATGLAFALAKVHRQRAQARQIQGISREGFRLLFAHSWPGNLRQLENNVAKLCELADMKDQTLIDESTVKKILESRLSGSSTSATDIVSDAALRLAQLTLNEKVESLDDGLSKFSEMIRIAALEASGGDIKQASEIIGDDQKLMRIVSVAMLAKREIESLQ